VLVGEHAHKFLRLVVDSKLEIKFAGKPSGFQAPSYKVYNTNYQRDYVSFLRWKLELLDVLLVQVLCMRN
jgi:hypothetical protein